MSDDTMILALDGRHAICLDPNARHYEWVMYKHPDGQWVSLRRATVDELNRARMSVAALQTSAPNREAAPPAPAPDDVIKSAVDRFLCWQLPRGFAPDCGISFDGRKDDEWNKNKTWPVGTNLLTAEQAREMFTHCLADAIAALAAELARVERERDQLRACAEAADAKVTLAARDVLMERVRQVTAEGWTPEHDDSHTDGQLALAASAYAMPNAVDGYTPRQWPWSFAWWKPSTPRRNLVKAAALILAEIERLDRAALGAKGE